MSKVKITWKAFGDKPAIGRFITSVDFETDFKIAEADVDQFLNVVYRVTNTYSGELWKIIEPKLSDIRTHTSLSVGDEVEIDGQVYVVADFGFEKIEDVVIKYLPNSYGINSVFSVQLKEEAGVK